MQRFTHPMYRARRLYISLVDTPALKFQIEVHSVNHEHLPMYAVLVGPSTMLDKWPYLQVDALKSLID